MVAGLQHQVTPTLMFSMFVYASAAATLGGLDSPGGAVIAGLTIGVVENMAAEFSQDWVGQDMKLVRRPRVHLRRPAVQAVRPVRHGEGGTGVIKIKRGLGRPLGSSVCSGSPRVVAFVLYIPTKTEVGTVGDMTLAIELAIAVMSLNLVLGYAGIISIGHSAFFGIGMYTTAILVVRYGWGQGWTLYVAAAIAFVVGALVALPALRLKGIYLALVTLALAVLFPVLVKWDKLEWLTEGPAGINGVSYEDIPDWPLLPELRGREGRAIFVYWVGVILLVLVLPRLPRAREEPRRPLADRHPRQRDGVGGHGRAPGADEDHRVRHLGGDVRRSAGRWRRSRATWPAPTSASSPSSAASRSS